MPRWHVALGHGQQASETRFRRQQIVKRRVKLLLSDAKADVKQVPLAVIQKTEVSLPRELFERFGERAQPFRCGCVASRGNRIRIKQGGAERCQMIA